MTQPTPAMWDKVLEVYNSALTNAEETYSAKAESMCFWLDCHFSIADLPQATIAQRRRTRPL